jgi:3-mercaptopyruvate sulfurtransferase SseA
MRRFLVTAASLLVASVACGQFKANQTSTSGVQTATIAAPGSESLDTARRITRDEAIKMVAEGKAVFVDVRTKSDYDASHIKGAISMPLTELLTRLRDLPPKKFLITYCA